jgi:uncharacterized protein (TIRG00374 family)
VESPRRKIPWWAPQVLVYAFCAACLIWVLRGYDLRQLVAPEPPLDWRWMALAVAADLAAYVCHGWRWSTLLSPVSRLGFWRTVQAVYVGLFANELFPLRPGEVIRCFLLAFWNDLRVSVSLASAAVERVIDGLWLLIAFVAIVVRSDRRIDSMIAISVQATALVLIAATVGFFWIVRHRFHAHPSLHESRWAAALRHITEGLQLMGNLRTLQLTAAISALYFALQAVTMWALMKAYSLDYSIWVAGGVLTLYRLGTVIPNGPGNLGLGNVACYLALRFFELGEVEAKTFSLLYLAAQTLPLLAGGAIATALTGVNIGELRERARAGSAPDARPIIDPRT